MNKEEIKDKMREAGIIFEDEEKKKKKSSGFDEVKKHLKNFTQAVEEEDPLGLKNWKF